LSKVNAFLIALGLWCFLIFSCPLIVWGGSFADVYKAGLKEYKNGNHKAAINLWKTLLIEYKNEAPPKHLYKVAYAAAQASEESGDDIQAAYYARQALSFVPDGQKAKEMLAELGKKNASTSMHSLMNDTSGEEPSKSVKLTPQQAEDAYNAGEVLAAEGKFDEAIEEYEKSATAGNSAACLALGNLYLTGTGVTASQKEAAKWIRKGAESGNIDAQYRLSRLYREGAGVVTDPDESLKWCKKAAEGGSPEAQCSLGLRYETGTDTDKKPEEAFRLYKLSADQGYADAQNNLATLYRQGIGTKADPTAAFALYKKAAEQGHALAQVSLGLCYSKGSGVEANPKEAALWLKKAADGGQAHAQFVYGYFLEEGKGIDKDFKEAAKYYEMAAKNGHPQALKSLAELKAKEDKGSGDKGN
jgi:hypothetical protein